MCISLGYTIPIEVKILKILKKTLPLLEDRKRVKTSGVCSKCDTMTLVCSDEPTQLSQQVLFQQRMPIKQIYMLINNLTRMLQCMLYLVPP